MATMEKLEGSKVKLTIEVSAEQFEAATQKAYQKAGKCLTCPASARARPPEGNREYVRPPGVF